MLHWKVECLMLIICELRVRPVGAPMWADRPGMSAMSTAVVAEEEVAVEAVDLDEEMAVVAVEEAHLGMPIISMEWILLTFCALLLMRR